MKIYYVSEKNIHENVDDAFKENKGAACEVLLHTEESADKDKRIAELEKLLADNNSSCPNHQDHRGIEVTEPFTSLGVVVESKFYKCSVEGCDLSWLSGRQESEVDLKIKKALSSRIEQLEKALRNVSNQAAHYSERAQVRNEAKSAEQLGHLAAEALQVLSRKEV